MPRFHFNIYDASSHIDVDGVDLQDSQAARSEGLRIASEMIRDEGMRTADTEEWRLEVIDASGLVLFRMDFTVVESPSLIKVVSH